VFSWSQVLVAALGSDRPTVAALPTYTVADALEDYWRYRAAKSPALSVQTDKSKAKAEIDDKLRAHLVSELTTSELERWYCGMVPVTEDRERQRRAQSTADRTRQHMALHYDQHKLIPSAASAKPSTSSPTRVALRSEVSGRASAEVRTFPPP
jgi:hypothetical protein